MKTMRIVVIVVMVLSLLLFSGCSKASASYIEKFGNEIAKAQFYKFEKLDSQIEDTVIAYEPFSSLGDIRAIETNKNVGKVLYRLTFNCKEKVLNGNEIIMEVGEEAFTVNDIKYGFETKEQYAGFLELIEAKFVFWKKALQGRSLGATSQKAAWP